MKGQVVFYLVFLRVFFHSLFEVVREVVVYCQVVNVFLQPFEDGFCQPEKEFSCRSDEVDSVGYTPSVWSVYELLCLVRYWEVETKSLKNVF